MDCYEFTKEHLSEEITELIQDEYEAVGGYLENLDLLRNGENTSRIDIKIIEDLEEELEEIIGDELEHARKLNNFLMKISGIMPED